MDHRIPIARHSRSRRSRLVRLAATAAATALVVAACADSGTGSDSGEAGNVAASKFGELQDGMINIPDAPDTPVEGGKITFASYSSPSSLDPAQTVAAVTTGGTELINIYDALMRYDMATDTVVPQMAESLTHDDEYQQWTLTLREGITFSDGAAFDADAVVASQQRYADHTGAPESAIWNANVDSVEATDDRTVVYTLTQTWPDFDFLLTSGPGMIVAPSAGPVGDGFEPLGAGPFTLAEWQPDNKIRLEARDDYWAGRPHLDEVEFAYMPTMAVAKESMFNGDVEMVFLREPEDVNELLDREMPGYVNMTAAANVGVINTAPGRPGADPRVRKAIQLAIDPGQLSHRAYGDESFGHSEIFPEYSRWHTDVTAPEQDMEAARALVAEAKADGFDGKIVTNNAPDQTKREQALVLEAQLESAGFDVQTDIMPTISEQVRAVAAEQDYDLSGWGFGFREADPFPKMYAVLHSDGQQVYGMYTSPEVDELLERFQVATDPAEQKEIMGAIQEELNDDARFVNYGYFAEYVAWQPNVHGIEGTSNSMVLFADAWTS